MDKDNFIELIDRENIDRKKAKFKETTQYKGDEHNYYLHPEVIIIKNELGKTLFNEIVKQFDYKEKGGKFITQKVSYPYFVLGMDWITAGCHWGNWGHYESLDDLSQDIDINNMQDDFDGLKKDFERMLRKQGDRYDQKI